MFGTDHEMLSKTAEDSPAFRVGRQLRACSQLSLHFIEKEPQGQESLEAARPDPEPRASMSALSTAPVFSEAPVSKMSS